MLSVFLQQHFVIAVDDELPAGSSASSSHSHPEWLANYPPEFHIRSSHTGEIIDARNNSSVITQFQAFCDKARGNLDHYTDGEVVDAIEHYFWGQREGIAVEMGALDGSPHTRSNTYDYVQSFGWKRILIEGNPTLRADLISRSPDAFSVSAVICEKQTKVHFIVKEYLGGIAEFMKRKFIKTHHRDIYDAGNPEPGYLDNVDWSRFPYVHEVDCIPMSAVFSKAKIRHVNFFILDVEGGELEVLKSINWSLVKFDVLCIETFPLERPPNYAEDVTEFLAEKGYINHSGQQGRNIWFTRSDFVPSVRPDLEDASIFYGMRKARTDLNF